MDQSFKFSRLVAYVFVAIHNIRAIDFEINGSRIYDSIWY